jgi:hypothetical protein
LKLGGSHNEGKFLAFALVELAWVNVGAPVAGDLGFVECEEVQKAFGGDQRLLGLGERFMSTMSPFRDV